MVGDVVLEEIEPEEGELGKDASLVGDAGGEDVVEGGDAIGGDEEEVGGGVGTESVDVAHLAAGEQRKRAEIGLEQSCVHWDDGTIPGVYGVNASKGRRSDRDGRWTGCQVRQGIPCADELSATNTA